ncbi:hypothetical protein HKD42_09920 [Altererythrobacter sp. RZ02]|uniref:Lipoprotein n=1 Tax=Pontixanthobacter rizhaonensis TaxID=2730337 RepID=A0A848QP41_9SPHN|nr:hypothetical protein [Pontixanthobacter rizhaonensis]NMW32377.1 hypothetical protein [Pontixanthobacter rizhaonensis]
MRSVLRSSAAACAILALAACGQQSAPAETAPQDAFWAALSSHCGKAFNGRLTSQDAADADMAGSAMVMHVRECSDTSISVPFHIQEADGEWNRSRTWVVTRTGDGPNTGPNTGLRLKHDHRHKDGEPDAVTMYGGDTADAGEAGAQQFPVDQFSIDMFKREGLDVSVTNVWRVEVDPADAENAQFAYQLKRTVEGGAPEPRLFRVEFDLTNPVEPPPAPWGF